MQQLGGRLMIAISAAVFALGLLASCGMFAARALQTNASPSPASSQAGVTPVSFTEQPSLSASTFNPSTDSLTVTSGVSQPAMVQASVVLANGGVAVRSFAATPVEGQVQVQWDGKDDRGNDVAPGNYTVRMQATDDAGRQTEITSGPISVTNKYILVSESQQMLYAYNGSSLFLKTPVTTGGPELPTPTGTFHVLNKTQDLYVYSPWPKGSPYWFPDVTYQYALDFYETSQYGLYIHDASWRHNYGPGSNAVDGTPGEDDTGTHGCINVPLDAQQQLYNWAPENTPVIVRS